MPEPLEMTIENELNAQSTPEQAPDAPVAPVPDPSQPTVEDPEMDIGGTKIKKSVLDAYEFDLDGGKKAKLADLRKGYMLNDDYTRKTQELAAERAKHKELVDWSNLVVKNPKMAEILATLTDKGITDKGFNEEMLDKVLGVLTAKQEEAAEKSDEIEAVLQKMDPLDPNYPVLKQALDRTKALEKKLGDLEQKVQGTEQQTRTQQQEQAVQQAQAKISSALEAMTDPAKPDGFKFESPQEKAMWRKEVLYVLAHNPRELKSEEDFHAFLKDVGKQVYDHFNTMFEGRFAAHLKKKNPPPAIPVPGQPPVKPKAPGTGAPLVQDGSLQDRIESMLGEEMKEEQQ